MSEIQEQIDEFLAEVNKLRDKYALSKTVGKDYYEPGMMEYLDKYYGSYDKTAGTFVLRFEARGTRYNGRTELIENVNIGDTLMIVRDKNNEYNSNNFVLIANRNKDVGNMPAELCNVIAPLYDKGVILFTNASVSFVEPISKRSRHAKQAVLFVELNARLET